MGDTTKPRKPRNKDSTKQSKVSENVEADKPKLGRPSIFTQELADEICNRIAEGESLRAICRGDNVPPAGTILRWVTEKEAFREQYEFAMEQRAEGLFDEMFEIADETCLDTISTKDGERPNAEWISRSRLRVDVRKWALSKMMPKKYGDKVQIGGAPDLPPIQSNVTVDPGEAYKLLLAGRKDE